MVDLDLKEIVNELGDAAWCEGKNFEDWVEPRVNAILQALAERDALKAEVNRLPAKWSEDSSLQTWFPITSEELESLRAENKALKAKIETARKQEPCGWQSKFVREDKWASFDPQENCPRCNPAQQLPDDARHIIDHRLNDDGEYYIRGKDINAILKGGENER